MTVAGYSGDAVSGPREQHQSAVHHTQQPVTLAAVPALVLGLGKTGESDAFGEVVDAHRLPDGEIVVVDRKPVQLKLFDPSGKFVRTIGRAGEGPGDYRSIGRLVVPNSDTLIVWDGLLSRLTGYSRSGRVLFTRLVTRNPPVQDPKSGQSAWVWRNVVGRFGGGQLLTTFDQTHFIRATGEFFDSNSVELVTGNATSIIGRIYKARTFAYFDQNRTSLSDFLPLGPTGSVALYDNNWFYSDGSTYQIEKRDLTGKLVATFRFPKQPRPVTPEDIASAKRAFLAPLNREDHKKFRDLYEGAFASLKLPATMPVLDMMAVDALGRIWAREYAFQEKMAHWLVMTKTGVYVGSVTLKSSCSPVQIERDFLLAHCKGEDDLDTVEVYTLS